MRRREFVALLGGAAAIWPLRTQAQRPTKPARLGFLGATFATNWSSRLESFRSGLRDFGYVEGRNVFIDYRWANENYDRLPDLAGELVRLNLDIILTYGTPATLATRRATTDIPIVFVYSGDAVAAGVVAALNQPGANVTGSTYFLPQLMAKRLELLRETIPNLKRAAVLVKPDNPLFKSTLPVLESAAGSLGVELQQFHVTNANELESAFSSMEKTQIGGVVVQEDAVFLSHVNAVASLALGHSLPLVGSSEFAAAGGLLGYGVDFLEMCRHAAVFVDKILKGTKPSDIPVEQASKFETVLNRKVASSIGVSVPTSILLRADRVIE